VNKHANWERALSEYLAGVDIAAMGAAPCAKFVSGAVLSQTGRDIHEPFEGKYTTPIGAVKALIKYGAGTLEATFDSLFDERPIGFAQRGDVIFYDDSVGICVGGHAIFINGGVFENIERARWVKAWAVG
jgi:hypothetical protein